MTTRPLVIRPEDLDQPGGGPLVVRPEELDRQPSAKPSAKSSIGPAQPRSLMDDISSWWERKSDYQGTLDEPGRSPKDTAKEVGKGALFAGTGTALAGVPALRGVAGMVAGGKLASMAGIPEWIGAIGGGSMASSGKLPGRFGGRTGGGEGGSRMAEEMAETEEGAAAATSPKLAEAMDADPVTRIPVPRREFPGENPRNMASVPRGELEGLAKTGKPGAGTQIQQLGGKVIYTPEEGYAPPRSSTTFSSKGGAYPSSVPPRARSSKTAAIDEATATLQGATRSRQTGTSTARLREEMRQAEERGNVERRVNPGLRDATGPDPVRQSLVREAQRVIDDPKATARDKRIARDQISDIKAHPFEGARGQDFVKEARAGKPKMTREQAEAADAKRRSPGRRKRLSEEIGND